jgi:hypothetical protein
VRGSHLGQAAGLELIVEVTSANLAGNYSFLGAPGGPYSGGVLADPGFDLVHVTFDEAAPLEAGLEAAVGHVTGAQRPALSIAGFELRIPTPLTAEGFASFNQPYIGALRRLGLEVDGMIPTTRTNVALSVSGVAEPSVHGFTYTVPGNSDRRRFLMSGVAEEAQADVPTMLDSIMTTLGARMNELGASWADATFIQLYGMDEMQQAVVDRVLKRIGRASARGVHWFPSLPPIEGLRLEIDVRSAGTEVFVSR